MHITQNKLARWLKQHQKQILIWSAGLFVSLILFSVLLLPIIVKSQLKNSILKATGRTADLESVSFNPFGMTLNLHGFKLYETDKKSVFVQFENLRVSFSTSSAFRFAPVVDELSLDKPHLNLLRNPANRYNFSDILDRMTSQPKKEKKETTSFSINNINLQGGSLDFEDQAVKGTKRHQVRNLQLTVPFISNIPYLAKMHTNPEFKAVINGANFSFTGKSKPLHESMETDLNLKLAGLDLPHYLSYLPAQIPVKLDSGKLTIDMKLAYRIHKDKKPELFIRGVTRLDDISVKARDGSRLASFKRLEIKAREIELFGRKIVLQQILLEQPALFVELDKKGKSNFQKLNPDQVPSKEVQTKQEDKKDANPFKLLIEELSLAKGTVQFDDKKPEGGFKAQLTDITTKITNISTDTGVQGRYEVTFSGDNKESFSANGSATIAPLNINSQFKLADLKLQRGWPYLKDMLTAPIKGNLTIEGNADWSVENGASVDQLAIHLQDISAEYGDKESSRISDLNLSGISFSQKENRAMVDEIKLSGGKVKVSKEADGRISALSMLKPPHTQPAQSVSTSKKTDPKTDQKPLVWQVKRINVSGLSTYFTDKSFNEPPKFKLSNINFSTSNLTGPELSAMPFAFSSRYGTGAPIKFSGTVTPKPFKFKGAVSFSKLPIQDFESYFPDNLNLFVLGGMVDSKININLSLGKEGKPEGSFEGSTGIRGLHIVDSEHEEDLLKWESLQLDRIKGQLNPFSLAISQIALNGVYSRIAISKDGSLNLQSLVTKKDGQAAGGEGQQAAKQALPASGVKDVKKQAHMSTQKNQISIGLLSLQEGTVDFSDAHLQRHFRTTFHNLGGRVSGLSSDMNTRAEVDLRGNLENHSPLQITGTINPLRDDLFVDLTISFKDIELAPATPYSGTYLGYRIDKGKLFLDLKYHIEDKKLKASNKIFVDQFTFGNPVESDKATSLPVRLGVALLKDRNGEIHLDLPVSGRTDDPEFSIWGVVWQVISNLFIKAATSPFSLLSSMFGSEEDLSSVSFSPGSALLAESEEKKLANLSNALNQRPGIKVELSGYVDKRRDPEGYRNELLLHKMRQEKFLALARGRQNNPGDVADNMVIQPDEYSRYLKAVYLKEKFPKPRNMIGMVKDLPDAEMKKLILANTKVGDQELQQLAVKRTATVQNFLIDKGKIDSKRLFQNHGDILTPPKKENSPAGRVELNPIAL